jgi:4-amino-4-deoxy-L-arabinose transferase-like glycosyltransferase
MAERAPESPQPDQRRRYWRAVEAVSLAVYLALACTYAFMIPAGGGPDESEHLAYVRSLAINRQLPALPRSALAADPGRIVTPQAQHPPAYYLLLTPLYRVLAGKEAAFYHAARLLSVLMGLAAILLMRRTAHLLFPHRPAIVALALVFAATFGTFAYVSGTLNNEPLAALVVAAGLYLGARALVGERRLLPMALLGVALGVGLLVKLTASVLVVPLLLLPLWLAARRQGAWAKAAEALRLLAVGLACAGAVSGWWFVRTAAAYGTPLARADYRPLLEGWGDMLLYPRLSLYLVLSNTEEVARSIWAPRWLLRASPTYCQYLMIEMLHLPPAGRWNPAGLLPVAVLLVGAVGVVLAWRHRGDEQALDSRQSCFMLVVLGVIAWMLLGVQYQALFVDSMSLLFAGRYTPVVLPHLGLLLAIGTHRLIPARRQPVGSALILAVAVCYNLCVMYVVYLVQS